MSEFYDWLVATIAEIEKMDEEGVAERNTTEEEQ